MQTLVEIGPSNALQGQQRRKNATKHEKSDTRSDLNPATRLVAPMLYQLSYGASGQNPNFNPYKLLNLKFSPLPSLSSFFISFLHNLVTLIQKRLELMT